MKPENKPIRKWIGMLKSRFIYDYKPFNRQRMIRFYSRFISAGDLCFDIGAHTGNRTAAWLRIGGFVIAVEPQPACVRLLHKKFGKNERFLLLEKAVSKDPGKAVMHISLLNPAISTLSEQWMQVMHDFGDSAIYDDSVEIDRISMDAIIGIFGSPEFCKIDVEGLEEDVLNGLSVPLKALSFEFFPTTPGRTLECINRLETLGKYRYNWSLTERFILREPHWLSADEMIKTILYYGGRKSGDIYARLEH